MKFKLMSATIVSVTLLATVSLMPSGGWAQDSQSDAAAAVKVSPATGIAGILVTTASSCPNVACETGDTCQFNLITGTSTNFSRFGATLGKASLLGCVAINQNTGVSVGSGASGDTNCFPATGTVILTQNSKAAGAVTIAFAGNVCELPDGAHQAGIGRGLYCNWVYHQKLEFRFGEYFGRLRHRDWRGQSVVPRRQRLKVIDEFRT